METDGLHHEWEAHSEDGSIEPQPSLMDPQFIRGMENLRNHCQWVASHIDKVLFGDRIGHQRELVDLADSTMKAAASFIAQFSSEGPLPKDQRMSLEKAITTRRGMTPLDHQELGQVARLSFRQLKRLNKQRLANSDRKLLKAMQQIKSQANKE